MNDADIINLSLEQTVEALGDPTEKIFEVMYERFPDLLSYKEENEEWENYMFEEIITNFMSFGDDEETAILTVKDMAIHHELIGVPKSIFKGMYDALFEVVTDQIHGPHKQQMIDVWRAHVDKIQETIEKAAA